MATIDDDWPWLTMSDHEWPQMDTNNFESQQFSTMIDDARCWFYSESLQMAKNGYEWLRMTMIDDNWPRLTTIDHEKSLLIFVIRRQL